MKKAALLCVFVMLIGAVPAFAADPNNTNVQQLKSKNPQIYHEIMNIKNQITSNLDKIKASFIQNKNLRHDIQNLRKSGNNQTVVSTEIKSIKNQIKNNLTEIKSLFSQNKNLRKEIQNIRKNQTI